MEPTAVSGPRTNDEVTSTALRGIRVVPRLPDIDFADTDVPRLWHGGSAGITAFWDALTIAGPPIESFFLRDARKLLPLVKSPALRQEFNDFMRQEAMHSRVHQRTHQLYRHWGVPVDELDAFMRRVLGWVERVSTTKLRSGMVVAGEHFLGEIGHQGLTNAALLAEADPRLARLLLWHFYEEVEHKAVCFDGFVDAHGDTVSTYLHRVVALMMAIGVLAFVLPVVTFRLLHNEGAAFRWREWRALGRHLFTTGGLWSGRGRAILTFLNPHFHPWKYRDDSQYLRLRSDLVRPEWADAASRGDTPVPLQSAH
jgi:predicted metal-dependent hydrolase